MINGAKYQFKCLLYLSFLSLALFMGIINSPLKVFAADLTGTSRDDTLYGTMADDKITGKDGKDSLFGNGGKDKIDGDTSDDFIQGDPGDDTLNANDGNDMVLGGSGSDKIDGGSGDDYLESQLCSWFNFRKRRRARYPHMWFWRGYRFHQSFRWRYCFSGL